MSDRQSRLHHFFSPEVRFITALYGLLLALFALLRLLLLWRNSVFARQIPASLLAESFRVGLRFDLAVSSYLLIPFFLLLLALQGRWRKWLLGGLAAAVGGVLFCWLAEIEFFRGLEFRLNTLVSEYMSHPKLVVGLIRNDYPVFPYLLEWAVLFAFFCAVFLLLYRRFLLSPPVAKEASEVLAGTMAVTLMLALMLFASRGGFVHKALQWDDAYFCEEPFANVLAQNVVFTLGHSALTRIMGKTQAFPGAGGQDTRGTAGGH